MKLACENHLHELQNTKVKAVKDNGKKYIKFIPLLVRHLQRNRLFFFLGGTLFVVRPCLHGAMCHYQTLSNSNSQFEAKMASQLCNVADIKHCFLSNGYF